MVQVRRHFDLQAKVFFVLIAVIVPSFLVVTLAEKKLTLPILEEEIRQTGVHAGRALAAEMDRSRVIFLPNPTPVLERMLQQVQSSQPHIERIDVVVKNPSQKDLVFKDPSQKDLVFKDPSQKDLAMKDSALKHSNTGGVKLLASSVEEDPTMPQTWGPLSDTLTSQYRAAEEGGGGFWDIWVPIEHSKVGQTHGPKKILGAVHVVISTQVASRLAGSFWRTTAAATFLSVVTLIVALSYFLRKTIANDRLLKQTQSKNRELAEELHDAQRQIAMNEKLAVMGQLTASFAHEIGTPLNAIGGHLQLIQEDLPSVDLAQTAVSAFAERLEIIQGQVSKIEKIVKSFLQSTSAPTPPKKLLSLNELSQKTVTLVGPRLKSLQVQLDQKLDPIVPSIRAVPIEMEQILLNLLNNSLDSLAAKREQDPGALLTLQVRTRSVKRRDVYWAEISIFDTGEGIRKSDLKKVCQPFFSTKTPDKGTGLGLTICHQLAHKNGGDLKIYSQEGAWTRVQLQFIRAG